MRHSRSTPPTSPAETITNVIIERLKAGVRPWRQPWTGGPVSRPLRVCGTPYRGVNVIWLWMAAQARGFGSPTWMTYHQAELLGAQVRKGERGTIAIFYRSYTKEIEDPATGEREDEARRVLKSFTVFNVDQIEGLPERFRPEPSALPEPSARDRELDAFFAAIPASLRHGGGEAYYMPSTDQITMPEVSQFRTRDLYRSTLAHELAHWTGHRSRLDRSLSGRFGSDAYAVEELVAELASAMIGAELGLPVDHLDDHASYLGSWLKVLKTDARAILTAAAKAEEASAYLLKLGGAERPAELSLAA
ncbi:Antirestriction protein ArdC [Sphingomonas guangdongensis]|mgnify:CR=1 FL=1|jgi:antirestriction protein ArdC|uniref:Antirestriction protein ArdC n=1 Tax=Sphingomonas guangdongensis TaxID=1141890 RepID=A0A285R2C2_9SPHN|nr:zincin-like metallopeptidase domain-containing protein [Sphingomonas guangdongensis]SOB88034.1 Antirestriction protein ArdC [Sphingomonas guangdongensis]